MALTFERVDQILQTNLVLLCRTRVRGKYLLHSYYFADRYLDTRKAEVAREVTELINGGVGGYIYVGHLQEYNVHPKRHPDGYLNISDMAEQEFIDLITKVTKHYK